jgi:hypothetical protein
MSETIDSECDKQLIRACEIVNADPEVRQIEAEFDALWDEISEPWDEPRKRRTVSSVPLPRTVVVVSGAEIAQPVQVVR